MNWLKEWRKRRALKIERDAYWKRYFAGEEWV